jgi:hypothetical protein
MCSVYDGVVGNEAPSDSGAPFQLTHGHLHVPTDKVDIWSLGIYAAHSMGNECWFVTMDAEGRGCCAAVCSAISSRDFRLGGFRSGCLIPTCAVG